GLSIDDANGAKVIPAGITITAVALNGMSVTMSQAATAAHTGDIVNVGSLVKLTFAQLGKNEGFGSDVGWNVSGSGSNVLMAWDPNANGGAGAYVPLAPGHAYRVQVMTHDGDQNKTGGDVGQFCANVVVPNTTGAGLAATPLMGGGTTRTTFVGSPAAVPASSLAAFFRGVRNELALAPAYAAGVVAALAVGVDVVGI